MTENPRDKFKACDVVLAVYWILVKSVADEVETSHADAFFVDGVIIERVFGAVLVWNIGDAD